MRQPAQKTKPRISQPQSFPAPTRGWIANENLAEPTPGGAAVLENWFPTATGLSVRAGSELYATLGQGDTPVRSMFSYLNGSQRQLFAATDTAIYDITTVLSPFNYDFVDDLDNTLVSDEDDEFGDESTTHLVVMDGFTSGNWVVVQFATAGGIYLVGVNGEDDGFVYDGTTFYPALEGGLFEINYDAETVAFTEGAILTGGTSTATATIYKVIDDGTTGKLWLTDIEDGPFEDNEAVTDDDGGSALVNGAQTVLVPALTGVPSSDLSYVWPYKQRLWFIQKESLSAWYLDVDSIGGELTEFPMGGIFVRGGSLLFGATWSLDSGAEGGLSEQCVFVTTEGEVAVYQGADPEDAATWSKVGVYRIGRPLGNKCFMRAGGDIVISTDIGFVPLSQAIQRDVAALAPAAVSYPIETAWNERVAQRSGLPWQAEVWPTKQMVVIALPPTPDAPPEMLVANARTGAWALYTGWNGTCVELFSDRLFFGSLDGKIFEAEVGGSDDGAIYTANCVPLFSDLGTPASMKIPLMARATLLSPYPVQARVSVMSDYVVTLPPAPDAPAVNGRSLWGIGIWGTSTWGGRDKKVSTQAWQSVSGRGYTLAPAIQISSGGIAPPTVDLVRLELLTQTGGVIS